jgi:hypothetical protein
VGTVEIMEEDFTKKTVSNHAKLGNRCIETPVKRTIEQKRIY